MGKAEEILAKHTKQDGAPPPPGVQASGTLASRWKGGWTEELADLFRQHKKEFGAYPDEYDGIDYDGIDYEAFVFKIKESLRTHINIKKMEEFIANYTRICGEPPPPGIQVLPTLATQWKGEWTEELEDLFRQYKKEFGVYPDGYVCMGYDNTSYEEFVAEIKECLKLHIELVYLDMSEDERAFFLGHYCPIYKKEVTFLCAETLDFFKGHSPFKPKELEEIDDLHAAGMHCVKCRFCIYQWWL